MSFDRISQQIAFVVEIDKLKNILRQTILMDDSRRENTAEHSWHIAVMAMLLSEYADDAIDVLHVMKMLLVHDIVEIDAGDTYCYDETGYQDKSAREQRAADRLFALLPADQAVATRALWEEFEAGESANARFANALDRLQPLLHNYYTQGKTWKDHQIRVEQVLNRIAPITAGSAALGEFAQHLVRDSIEKGYFSPLVLNQAEG